MKSHQIHIPFPEVHPGLEARYKLAYDRPININVVGSYARKTATEVDERLTVDLAVTMPSVRVSKQASPIAANRIQSTFSKKRTFSTIDIFTSEHIT